MPVCPVMVEQIIPYRPDITEQKCDLALTRQHRVSTHAGQSAGLTTRRFRVPLLLRHCVSRSKVSICQVVALRYLAASAMRSSRGTTTGEAGASSSMVTSKVCLGLAPRIDLPGVLRKDLEGCKRDYYDVVGFSHLDDDHIRGACNFFYLEHAEKYQENVDGRFVSRSESFGSALR